LEYEASIIAERHSDTAVPEVVQTATGVSFIFVLPNALKLAILSSISKVILFSGKWSKRALFLAPVQK
jgi:hypothetical protein